MAYGGGGAGHGPWRLRKENAQLALGGDGEDSPVLWGESEIRGKEAL